MALSLDRKPLGATGGHWGPLEGLGRYDTVIVKASDMGDEMQQEVFRIAEEAMREHTLEREIASVIKKEMDSRYGHTWHVIVGRSFGSYVTHEKGRFVYFYVGPLALLVFKT